MSVIPDEFLIKEKFDLQGGGSVEIHDSRFLPQFLEIERKIKEECETFHSKMINMGVKAYRCNDGWVRREDLEITFFSDEKEKGFYWGNYDLKEGDLIFIGNYHTGGRFAKITHCDKMWNVCNWWSRRYSYEPLVETLDGTDGKYVTEYTMTRKQKFLRFLGLLDILTSTDICYFKPTESINLEVVGCHL